MATNAERIELATVQIETASAQADASSQVMYDFANFGDTQDVTNQEAEVFPSLQKFIKTNQDAFNAFQVANTTTFNNFMSASNTTFNNFMTASTTTFDNAMIAWQLAIDNTSSAVLATQAEAEAGVENSKTMTALRTKQAIEELATGANPNLLYNSSFTVDIDGNAGGGSGEGFYPVDGWYTKDTSEATWQISRASSGAGPTSGYTLETKTTVADAGLNSGDYIVLECRVEGYDMASTHQNYVDATEVTMSCHVWVQTTGTYCMYFRDSHNNYSYVWDNALIGGQYNYIEKTVQLRTTGGSQKGAVEAFRVGFCMYCGDNRKTNNPDTWESGEYFCSANQFQMGDSANQYHYLAKPKLEIGNKATTYEHPNHSLELTKMGRFNPSRL